MDVRKLHFPFNRGGFTHELLERDGLVCLVKRSKPKHWHYEVVKLQIRAPSEFQGRHFPEREKYPSDEEWGIYGFTYLASDLKSAQERYLSLAEAYSGTEVVSVEPTTEQTALQKERVKP